MINIDYKSQVAGFSYSESKLWVTAAELNRYLVPPSTSRVDRHLGSYLLTHFVKIRFDSKKKQLVVN